MNAFFTLSLSVICHFLLIFFECSNRWCYTCLLTIYIFCINIAVYSWGSSVVGCILESFVGWISLCGKLRWNLEGKSVVEGLCYWRLFGQQHSSSIIDDWVDFFYILMCVYVMRGDVFGKNFIQVFYYILGCCLFCYF